MAGLSKRQESLIRSLSSRHGRRKSGLCLCEGVRCCQEAISLRKDLVELVVLREGFEGRLPAYDAETVCAPAAAFDSLAGTVSSQGVILLMRRPEPPAAFSPLSDPFVFVLDRVSDPGNFGTIVRTARAAGLKELWHTKGSADPFSEKCVRSASAAQFAVGLREFESLGELAGALRTLGVSMAYRTVPTGGLSLYEVPELFSKTAIVMGSEAFGAAEMPGSADLSIPMPGGAESLNVAQAATVILFEHVRRQAAGPLS